MISDYMKEYPKEGLVRSRGLNLFPLFRALLIFYRKLFVVITGLFIAAASFDVHAESGAVAAAAATAEAVHSSVSGGSGDGD